RVGGGLRRPVDEGEAEGPGEGVGELGLAGAGLAAHEKRPLQGEGTIHRRFKLGGSQVAVGTAETDEVHTRVVTKPAPGVRPGLPGRRAGRSARRAWRRPRRRKRLPRPERRREARGRAGPAPPTASAPRGRKRARTAR